MASDDLRARIAEALMAWAEGNNAPQYASMRRPATVVANANSRADAVLAVVQAELDKAQQVNDDAWGSVWLHGKWSWLTKNMTTPEREHAADCVARWSARLEPDEPSELEGLRWWREPEHPTCTCRGLPVGAGESCNAHQMKESR